MQAAEERPSKYGISPHARRAQKALRVLLAGE